MTCGAMRFGVAAAASARASAARSRGVVASPQSRSRTEFSIVDDVDRRRAPEPPPRAAPRDARSRAVAEPPPSGSTWEEDADEDADADEEVIPLANPDAPFEYDPDRAYHRYRDLEPLRANLAGLVYGPAIDDGGARGPAAEPRAAAVADDVPRDAPSGLRRDARDAVRHARRRAVGAGVRRRTAGDGVGGGAAIQNAASGWIVAVDASAFIVCELCANRATWLADTHERRTTRVSSWR